MDVNTPLIPPPPANVVLPPPSYLQQAPFKVLNLFPTIRLTVYAILQDKVVPKTVVLRGVSGDGAEIELPVDVAISHLPNTPGAPPAIHALAARKIIQDLEDGRHNVAQALHNRDDLDLVSRTVTAMIVRLGKTYSIVSKHTSFVAIDESKLESEKNRPIHVSVRPSVANTQSYGAPPNIPVGLVGFSAPVNMVPLRGGGRGAAPSFGDALFGSSGMFNTPGPRRAGRGMSAGYGSPPPTAAYPAQQMQRRMPQQQQQTEFLDFSARGASLHWENDQGNYATQEEYGIPRGRVASAKPFGSNIPQLAASTPVLNLSDPLEALARSQSFDGRFSLDVLKIIQLACSVDALRAKLPSGVSDGVMATVVTMAFLSSKLSKERDSWEGMYEKANDYLEASLPSGQVEILVSLVSNLLV